MDTNLQDIIEKPFCQIGGYEKALVLSNGTLICFQCCKNITNDIQSDINILGLTSRVALDFDVDGCFCEKCNTMIIA